MQNQFVVCLSQINYWNDLPYPIHHMMRAMSRHNRVLWVNPTSVAFPSTKKKSFWTKVKNRLLSHLRYFVRVQPGLFVFSPIIFPIFTKQVVYNFNDLLLRIQLRMVLISMRVKRPYVFVALPTFANVVASLSAKRMIYYISDKYSGYEHVTDPRNKAIIEGLNQRLIQQCDYILYTARMFFDEMDDRVRQKSFFMHHGVDVDFFQKPMKTNHEQPHDLAGIKHPMIGYFGFLTKERCNMEVVRWCAERRPDWSFVFIGMKWDDFPEVDTLENVHFLGPKEHADIPVYGKYFDVCIINRNLNEAVIYSNPTKVNEFLALGKPIVSVPIDHLIRDYNGLISTAGTGKEFEEKIEHELQNDSQAKVEKRLAKVRSYSWENMVKYISALFEDNTEYARRFFDEV